MLTDTFQQGSVKIINSIRKRINILEKLTVLVQPLEQNFISQNLKIHVSLFLASTAIDKSRLYTVKIFYRQLLPRTKILNYTIDKDIELINNQNNYYYILG